MTNLLKTINKIPRAMFALFLWLALITPTQAKTKETKINSDKRKTTTTKSQQKSEKNKKIERASQPIPAQIVQSSTNAKNISNPEPILKAGYWVAAAVLASERIRRSPKQRSESIITLAQVAKRKNIESLLVDIAKFETDHVSAAEKFGSSWYYYAALGQEEMGNKQKSISYFERVPKSDSKYLAAEYESAVIKLDMGQKAEAELGFRNVLNRGSRSNKNQDLEISNYAKLALARFYYEEKRFVDSIKFYRSVSRDSGVFYPALFEQAWAFFLAGYPNHALGALYGVESPFFKLNFNPESSIVRSMIFYWMCRYDDSKAALADFNSKHADAVESLADFLDRQRLKEESAFRILEDYNAGVSAESIGLDKSVLDSAVKSERVSLLHEQYIALMGDKEKLDSNKTIRLTEDDLSEIKEELKRLRQEVGSALLNQLQSTKQHFDRLREQSQFLYVELLMSEKEQLLGRELHAESKIDRVTQRKNIAGWGQSLQGWRDNRYNEFWWDEVGFYIYGAEPKCNVKN